MPRSGRYHDRGLELINVLARIWATRIGDPDDRGQVSSIKPSGSELGGRFQAYLRFRRRHFVVETPNKHSRAGFLTLVAATALGLSNPSVAEVCRFAGTTEPSGKVSVTSNVVAANDITRIDVSAAFETTAMFWFHIRYLVDEVSIWRAGELETVGVNTRYLVGSHIVRQTWDVFRRDHDALHGYRVQAKTLADFQRRHPGFVQHWDPSTFGLPWLDDYPLAPPERRADLDLTHSPASSNPLSPLALAFYWVRWLPLGNHDEAVFLPGFKADKLVDVPLSSGAWNGGTLWRSPLRYPAFSKTPVSTATVWMLPDRRLVQLAMDLHEPRGDASGFLAQEGCQGPPIAPTKVPR